MPPVSIIILAYNEAENVVPVLHELQEFLRDEGLTAELIVVDDGSTDDTWARAQSALRPGIDQLLRHDSNRGMGAGLKTGVAAARHPFVTFLPADGQVEPAAIATLLAATAEGDPDLVLSLYADRDDGPMRKVLSLGVRALVTATQGVRLRSDGPYLFKRALFLPEQLPSDSFFINFEFPIGALRAGLRTQTVTVRCRPRLAGSSKSARLDVVVRVGRELLALRVRKTTRILAQYAGR